jgi:hypothetical protein
MERLQQYHMPTSQKSEHKIKNKKMSVNSNPAASQLNMKKTGDLPLLSNIPANFRKNSKRPDFDTQEGTRGD